MRFYMRLFFVLSGDTNGPSIRHLLPAYFSVDLRKEFSAMQKIKSIQAYVNAFIFPAIAQTIGISEKDARKLHYQVLNNMDSRLPAAKRYKKDLETIGPGPMFIGPAYFKSFADFHILLTACSTVLDQIVISNKDHPEKCLS